MSLHCRCFVCHGEMEIADEHIGKLVKCPHCNLSVNPAVVAGEATSLDSLAGRARPEMDAQAAARRRLLMAESAARDGSRDLLDAPAAAEAVPKVRRSGLLLAVAGALLTAAGTCLLIVQPPLAGGDSDTILALLLALPALMIGLPLLLAGAVRLAADMRLPSLHQRTTPVAGLGCFLGHLLRGHPAHAYSCTLQTARSNEGHERPEIEVLGLPSLQFSFATMEGFAAYWSPIVRPSSIRVRRPVLDQIETLSREGDYALVGCRLRLSFTDWKFGFSLLLFLVGLPLGEVILYYREPNAQDLIVRKLLRCLDGQWYLVSGELDSPEDGAFDEAVRISRLSDLHLREELAGEGCTPCST